jgi:CheY-like chemotaxis protein
MNHELSFLYVEDDATSREVMRLLMVHRMGYSQVTIFEDSRNFPEKIAHLHPRPDLIFLDIHMQPYDGFQMLAMLRQNPAFDKVRVVALTASVMNEEINQLRRAGFDSGLAKPLDQRAFPDLIRRILGGEEIWHIT